MQLAKDISDLFYHRNTQISKHVGKEVDKREGDGVLFVFDGFDEFPSKFREKSLVMDIISGYNCLPKATVLVTSRPSALAELETLLQAGIGRHIQVLGFSEKEILGFAQSVFNDTNLFTEFKTYLSANPIVKGMMYNPLNCAIVIGVYQHTYESGKPVPHTQTQLYAKLTRCLLLRYLKERQHPLGSKLPDNLEDLSHGSDLYKQLIKVGELAFNGTLKEQTIFKQLPEGYSDLGLLVKHTALYTGEESITYNFFHLTLQEYMSAFYISQLSADEQRLLFNEHYSTSMDVVWRFVAGLTKMQYIGWDEVKAAESRLEYRYRLPEEVTISLIQYLYEAQDVRSCESVFGHDRVILYDSSISNFGYYALGYCVAACSNTWGVYMMREGLEMEMLVHGMKSVDYGGGSIEKLYLSFSEGIMNQRENVLQIPHQILQHIKSLSLVDCDIDQRGFEILAECIPYLHSLTSLNIRSNPGGDGSLVKLLQALSKHEKLQDLLISDIVIGMDDVAALAALVQPSSSLRRLDVGNEYCLTEDVANNLVKTVLSPSSLNTVYIKGCEYLPEDIETISDSISFLSVYYYPYRFPYCFQEWDKLLWLTSEVVFSPYLLRLLSSFNPPRVKGGTKLGQILRGNTQLKELNLHIYDRNDRELHNSLKDNHSLEKLELYEVHHLLHMVFIMSKKETICADPRIINPPNFRPIDLSFLLLINRA